MLIEIVWIQHCESILTRFKYDTLFLMWIFMWAAACIQKLAFCCSRVRNLHGYFGMLKLWKLMGIHGNRYRIHRIWISILLFISHLIRPVVNTSKSDGRMIYYKMVDDDGEVFDAEGPEVPLAKPLMNRDVAAVKLQKTVGAAITENDIIASDVLSGNRNFEGRVHALTRANYLASPPLVVAYALAGTVDIDFEKEPIGVGNDGKDVYFRDI